MAKIKSHRKGLSFFQRDALIGLFFVSFFIVGFLIIYLPAIIESINLSMHEDTIDAGSVYVGWKNYNTILRVDPEFIPNVASSLGSVLVNVIVIIIYSLVVSNLLNKNLPGKGVFRALLFLPVIISAGVIDQMMGFSAVTSSVSGSGAADTITQYIMDLNINESLSAIIGGAIQNINQIISRSGVQIVIFLAGLQAISPSIYEAAYVEGCTAWESFWKITMPMVSPLIVVNVVYTFIDSFTNSQNVVMSKIMEKINVDLEYGIASAMSWVYFILVGIMLVAVVLLINKLAFYET